MLYRAPARWTAAITTRAGARPLDGGDYHLDGRLTRDFRGLTRDFRVSVGSLVIPGIVVSLEIPVFPIFSCKNSGKS